MSSFVPMSLVAHNDPLDAIPDQVKQLRLLAALSYVGKDTGRANPGIYTPRSRLRHVTGRTYILIRSTANQQAIWVSFFADHYSS